MKKIFAIALVGLFSLTFVNDANAFDNDNEIVFSIGEYDAPVDAVAFEIVPVTTDFVFNVAGESVNYFEGVEDFVSAVNTEGIEITNSFNDSSTFVDVPIDYGIYSKTDFTLNEPVPNLTKPIDLNLNSNEFNLNEPLPNLTEYVTKYNKTYGYASPEIVKEIASNVGKFTKYNL